jgi:hypothetical protein
MSKILGVHAPLRIHTKSGINPYISSGTYGASNSRKSLVLGSTGYPLLAGGTPPAKGPPLAWGIIHVTTTTTTTTHRTKALHSYLTPTHCSRISSSWIWGQHASGTPHSTRLNLCHKYSISRNNLAVTSTTGS